jgi:transketolase
MTTEQLAVNTIKALAMDGVQRANSGHPGMPMGMADIATVLWTKHLLVDPTMPDWPDRDRFVLSNGHGSMLLYSLLHLSGFGLELADLQRFRQLGSLTPGHPELDRALGIEMTTGPLGQGFATGIGMALGEAHLRAAFGPDLVNHRTYAFVSDGDLMEGISSEAGSLAGRLGLGKLTYLYDDNEISIGGSTDITFTEDVGARFAAFGWQVLDVDGHDRVAVDEAITASKDDDRPTLVACHTHIAHGAPTLQDTSKSHGSPLGDAEISATKEAMGFPVEPSFHVPDGIYEFFATAMAAGTSARHAWEARRDRVFESSPEVAETWRARHTDYDGQIGSLGYDVGDMVATRKASERAINALAPAVPALVGGSADLEPSTNTYIKGAAEIQDDLAGRNIRFGVREHAMGAIVNGMAVHGGIRPYGATFLVFNDYMRPATRLAAVMHAPSIYVYTHDSVFLGEDGPTHQPIEQMASLRAMPNMWVVRPADATETAEAWELALRRTGGPTSILLTRQAIPVLDRSAHAGAVHRGGYVLREGSDATLIATGSEVHVALEAAEVLAASGVSLRVVSMPCVEAFDDQDEAYRQQVLGTLPVATLEAGVTMGWHRFAGTAGLPIGIDHFGASAPWKDLAADWGFTGTTVAARIETWLDGLGSA